MAPEDYYFGCLIAWRQHPGYLREGAKAPSLDEIADIVDEIMIVRKKRWHLSEL